MIKVDVIFNELGFKSLIIMPWRERIVEKLKIVESTKNVVYILLSSYYKNSNDKYLIPLRWVTALTPALLSYAITMFNLH